MNLQELSDITDLNQPLREQVAVAIEQARDLCLRERAPTGACFGAQLAAAELTVIASGMLPRLEEWRALERAVRPGRTALR
jgi:hypothetical protein